MQGIVITPATRSIRHLEKLRDRGTLVCCSTAERPGRALLGLGRPRPGRGARRRATCSSSGTAGSPSSTGRCTSRSAPSAAAACGGRRACAGARSRQSIIEYTIDPITALGQAEHAVDELLALDGSPDRRRLRERPDRLHGAARAGGAPGPRPPRHQRGRLRRRRVRGDAHAGADLDPPAEVRGRQDRRASS